MYKVLNADDVLPSQYFLNHRVGSDGGAPVINLHETSLVDQLPNALLVGVSPGDVRFANTEHVKGGLVKFNEDSIVDLSKTEQLKSFADLRMNLVLYL